MKEWEQREAELLRKENAWLDELNPFMKMVDSNIGFLLMFIISIPIAFAIGTVIGLML
jgi:hypothetical protein